MPLATATVEFVALRNDLANLPQSLTDKLFTANIPVQNVVVELDLTAPAKSRSTESYTRYLGWTGMASAKSNTIELDPTFASALNLSHGASVNISVSTTAPTAHTIVLEPVTVGDWEIVETHTHVLETYMINQVRAVAVNQAITVFPSATALATLKVTSIIPPPPAVARISPTSEVHVAPKTHKQNQADDVPESVTTDTHHANTQQSVGLFVRATVSPYLEGLDSRELQLKGNLPPTFKTGCKVMVSLPIPPTIGGNAGAAGSGAGSGEEAELSRASAVCATYYKTSTPISGISYGLSNALGLVGDAGIGARIYVKQPAVVSSTVNATLRPYTLQTSQKLLSSKTSQLSNDEVSALGLTLIGKGLIVPPMDPILPHGGIIDTDSKEWGRPGRISWGSETPLAESKRMQPQRQPSGSTDNEKQPSSKQTSSSRNNSTVRPVVGQDKLIQSVANALGLGNGVLLHGSRGCGKTVLVDAVLSTLKQQHVKPLTFACGTYTDKALPAVRDALKKLSMEALWTAPSVVVFDDIDKMIPAQQEHSADSSRLQNLAEVFQSIWQPMIAAGKVSILATSQNESEVHSHLLSSHLLDDIKHLKSPDKELRELIMRTAIEFVGLKPSSSLDLLEVVGETEGYQPGDLWVLIERLASILAVKQAENVINGNAEDADEGLLVTTDALVEAASDFVPASLRGVKLEKPNTKWEDVGGLDDTKRVMLETLEWPTKYAPVFANCPLRLRSGLLLYGYPGCGKTMLASAVASKTGLNFISVKGPEILNKYIGASEQSVRDLFDRAQAAKPCVLFFDEFDSIAPKRGHDATGVTDRVVNQLLTQMDGAEGLDGVYVLAATSRPDMIDSALLRPGRLDKSLLCGMPSASERYDIMVRAARNLRMSPDVDLHEVAAKAAHFSGADVQALVYNAYLGAVHDVLNAEAASQDEVTAQTEQMQNGRIGMSFQIGPGDPESAKKYFLSSSRELSNGSSGVGASASAGGKTAARSQIMITPKDMEKALAETKPSISADERARFRTIYSEFSTDRNGEMPSGLSSNEVGGRVTLQ